MGKTKYNVVGYGKRPNGAKNCGVFKDDKKAISYGIPSGHSQSAMACPSYILFNHMYDNVNVIILLYILGACVMASRVYFNCHTVQQVLVGGLFGVLFAYIFTMYKEMLIQYI